MNTTSTVAGRRADRARPAAPRDTASQAVRAAGRQLLATAGNQVLKAAVDRAVSKVDRTAGRLDAVAAGHSRPSRGRVAGTPSAGADTGPGRGAVARAKVGAAFSFVVQRAMVLLELIRRWARQLLDAFARLVLRARGVAADDDADDDGEERAEPPTDGDAAADDEPQAATAPAGQAQRPRRRPPAAGTATAPGRRRAAAGGRSRRSTSDE